MKHINKTSGSARLASLLAGAALFGLASQSALAVGTASGTSISNSATVSYSVATVAQTPITSAPVAFVVDNKVNLTVAKDTDNATTVPGSSNQAVAFTVTNNGNTAQRFSLTAIVGASTLTNPLTNARIYLDVNNDNAWDAGDTLYVNAGTFGDVAPDGTLNLLIVADAPAAESNGQTEVYNLLATTVDAGTTSVTAATAGANTAGVDVVFADITGSAAGDVANDGKHSASATYTIATATLTVTKTATLLCDPINGNTNPKNVPGAAVQYAITITNAAGATSATLSQVSETLAAALGFDPGLISGAGAGTNCVAGTGNQSASGFGAVSGAGVVTTYTAPGSAAQAVTAGASVAGQNVTVNFATLAGGSYGLAGGVLPANSFVTVYFNAFVQ